ncbi:MAG: hypothetical protein A3F41_05450 [Coxiella sp. RIFCSPHIGHO2_12_FULL_44_14]|nr:MAG: hypothetical protein A3F41_05450 [Coxiella sp. RIFCSPHIGHO2_12_FULL_44_14]
MTPSTNTRILSISELNFQAKALLEQNLGHIWVTGELSNLARPHSGHWYFSLKDNHAQIRCAMFRTANLKIMQDIKEGMQVLVFAKASLYTARGDYQLIIEELQVAGAGALQVAFEKLKKQLASEGLFANEHKKPLPTLPKQIGVVTSATGAALQDILKVLKRRFASIPVIIYPCQVQGDAASQQIAEAIQIANHRKECDVLIVGRGGGSIEDLWCFNEPNVAYAIFNSDIPIVSGVGHEVDVTIADLVADVRAPTPSAAAETVSPNQIEISNMIANFSKRLQKQMQTHLAYQKLHIEKLQKALKHPREKLQEYAQLLDQYESRLLFANKNALLRKQDQIATFAKALNAVNPLAVLERGYAVVSDKDGTLITRAKAIKPQQALTIKMHDGVIDCISR